MELLLEIWSQTDILRLDQEARLFARLEAKHLKYKCTDLLLSPILN